MKARIKKTGEIVDIIDYFVYRSAVDWVSYVDSKGREHYRESYNRCLDFEPLEQSNSNVNSDKHWQDVREYAAIAAMQGMLASGQGAFTYQNREDAVAKAAILCANALVEELKKK